MSNKDDLKDSTFDILAEEEVTNDDLLQEDDQEKLVRDTSSVESRSYKYSAFISYSHKNHKDRRAATKLTKCITKYGVPDEFVGQQALFGPVGEQLPPPFRDREHLAPGGELSESIITALEDSASLIVICSPYSAASGWVGKEIGVFLKTHPENPTIIPVIPPCVGANISVHDCLNPRYLQFVREKHGNQDAAPDPIVLDMRKGKDGELNAFRRLMASLLRIKPDSLSKYGQKGVRLRRSAIYILRWVFLLPGAYLASIIGGLLSKAIIFLNGDAWPLFENIIVSTISAVAFFFAGYKIAPAYQKYTVITLSILVIFISGFSLALTIASDPSNGPQYVTLAVHTVASLAIIFEALRDFKDIT